MSHDGAHGCDRVHSPRAISVAVLAGAVALAWPAILNGYPILFTDTATFLEQVVVPDPGWDKPLVYGPFLAVCDAGRWLAGPVAVQALILSHLLWLTQRCLGRCFGRAGPARHAAFCAGLGALTAAPWFVSFLMPDVFSGVTILVVALLGLHAARLSRAERVWLTALGVLAIASHLTHLIVAASVVACVRARLRAAAALAGAVALLVATNWAVHGRASVSPYGSVFALARLVGDGPARAYLQRACPAAGYRLCDWLGRLPADSDAFLWNNDGPVWGMPGGARALAPEASAIVARTVLAEPVAVARAALLNTGQQLLRADIGDTLAPLYLYESVGQTLRWHFPAAETARFLAGRQAHDTLAPVGAALVPVHRAVLVAGLLGSLWVAARDPARRRLALACLLGVLANAAATGALSGPHDRYQARVAWVLVLPPAFAMLAASTVPRERVKRERRASRLDFASGD